MDVRLASHMDCLSTVFLEFRVYHTFSFLSYDASQQMDCSIVFYFVGVIRLIILLL